MLWPQRLGTFQPRTNLLCRLFCSQPYKFTRTTVTKCHKQRLRTELYLLTAPEASVCSAAKSRLTLQPLDCSPPDSFLQGISQARILERVAIAFSRGSSQPRDWTHVSCISCRQIPYRWATWEAQRPEVWDPGVSRSVPSEIWGSFWSMPLTYHPAACCVFIFSDCIWKKPQTGHLKLQTFIFPQIWRLEAHDQGVSTFSFWLPDHCLLSVSSRGGKRENCSVSPYSHQDSSPTRLKRPHLTLITSF